MNNDEMLKSQKEKLIKREILPELYKLLPKKHVTIQGKKYLVRYFKYNKEQYHCILLRRFTYSERKKLRKRLSTNKTPSYVHVATDTRAMCWSVPELYNYLPIAFPEKFKTLLTKKKITARAQKAVRQMIEKENERITEEALFTFDDEWEIRSVASTVIEACVNNKLLQYSLGPFDKRTCSFPLVVDRASKKNPLVKILDDDEDDRDWKGTVRTLNAALEDLNIDKVALGKILSTSEDEYVRLYSSYLLPSPVLALLDPSEVVRRYTEIKLGKVSLPKRFNKRVEKLWGPNFIQENGQ